MKQTELDTILTAMLDAHPGISDLLFTVNRPFQVESYGELKEARIQPAVKVSPPFRPSRSRSISSAISATCSATC